MYHNAQFLMSASDPKQLPADVGLEVAFAGRSNAGKSSALNTITNRQGLARTSKTPGRTQLINVFEMSETQRLIDLPGYGYAKVPLKVKAEWEKMLARYIETRESLTGLILLMDIRHPLKELDWLMIEWLVDQRLPIHVLLTKSDKLKRGPAKNTLQKVRNALKSYEDCVTVQLFSSLTKEGVDEAIAQLDTWLLPEKSDAEDETTC